MKVDVLRLSKSWPIVWFARYWLLHFVPLLILYFVFLEQDGQFLGLSAFLTFAVALFAWGAADKNIKLGWRIGLATTVLSGWAFMLLFAYSTPGDTDICYDRLQSTGLWTRIQNLGPDPSCPGIPLQDVAVQ